MKSVGVRVSALRTGRRAQRVGGKNLGRIFPTIVFGVVVVLVLALSLEE